MSATNVAAGRRASDELRAIARAGQEELGFHASAGEVLAFAERHFGARDVAVAGSMSDGVLSHFVSQTFPGVDVFFIDTGYHFEETLRTRDRVAAELNVRVVDVRPELTVAEQDDRFGRDLFARDPAECCRMRKVEPLKKALAGYGAWFSGVRRDESPTRANAPLVSFDEARGLVKFNPIAGWSSEEAAAYSARHGVPINLLLTQGYPSIGCAPCTSPVAEGDDPRAGRWAGLLKTECGIHL
ncbi:phosphoadenylyl-sulfate reductase [Zhihengliuella somnathii]